MKSLQQSAGFAMESRLSVRQLRAFVAVYRLGKLADAAQLLSVTPSAVSVLVRQMESGMGVRLFDRHTRALEPTAAAHDAVGRAERILGEIDALGGSLRGLGTRATGRVHLAATPAVGMVLLPAAVKRFVKAYPAIQLVLDDCAPNQFVQRILSGQVEFGIGTPDGRAVGIEQRVLVNDTLSLVCPANHPLARQKQVRWAQLAGEPIIAGTPGYGVRRLTDAAAAQAGVELRIVNEVNFLTSALWMVSSGLGLAIFPAALAASSPQPDLALRPLAAPKVSRSISLVTRQGRTLSPACAGFVEVLEETLRGASFVQRGARD
jgi:DNA-binding transcriptional LysR family regulator